MNITDVAARLADLPRAFRRDDPTFALVEQSLAVGVARYTTAADGVMAQTQFLQATGRWLDVWANLFGVPRRNGEGDGALKARILATLSGQRSTVVAIEQFLQYSFGVAGTVSESLPTIGWTLAVPNTSIPIATITRALGQVRPAGVPFNTGVSTSGSYISTVNYFGAAKVTGAFLGAPNAGTSLSIPQATTNSVPSLGTTFLTDPTLNPSL